jgi:hypothetical protein
MAAPGLGDGAAARLLARFTERAAFRRLARSPILSVMAWETLRLREPGICAAAQQRALVRDKPAQRPGRDEYADS